MSAMSWTAVPQQHPDTARAHRTRRDTVAAPSIRRVPGTAIPQPPVCDLVDVAPQRRRNVQQWVDRYARTVLEIIAGERPVAQIARWTTLAVHHDLSRRAHLVARAGRRAVPLPTTAAPNAANAAATPQHTGVPRATVRSVHVSFVDESVVEASVHVRQGERSRAFAARFEWRRDRWVCTALDFC